MQGCPSPYLVLTNSPIEASLFLLDHLLTVLHRDVHDLRLKVPVGKERPQCCQVKGPSPQPRELLAEEGGVRPEAVRHWTSRKQKELVIVTDTADVHWRTTAYMYICMLGGWREKP